MAVKRVKFHVLVERKGAEQEYDVEVRNVDRLQSEVAARGFGVLVGIEDAPMVWTNLWIFHAMKRLGLYDGGWQEFKTDVVGFEAGADEDVDPTRLGELTSSSSS